MAAQDDAPASGNRWCNVMRVAMVLLFLIIFIAGCVLATPFFPYGNQPMGFLIVLGAILIGLFMVAGGMIFIYMAEDLHAVRIYMAEDLHAIRNKLKSRQ